MPLVVSPQAPHEHKKHLDFYEVTVVVFIAMIIVGGFVSWRYFRIEEQSSSAYDQPTPQAAYDRQTPTPSASATPQETARTNPFADTNPFSNQYENPFQ